MPETTIDHLDFIRIRGLQGADTEVFQGAAGGGASTAAESASNTADLLGAFAPPDEVMELLDILGAEAESLDGANEETEATARSRGRSRAIGALVPIIAGPIAKVLPWFLKFKGNLFAMQLFQYVIKIIIDDVEDNFDPTSERWRLRGIENKLDALGDTLKTALIWEDGLLQIDKSILETALLEEDPEAGRVSKLDTLHDIADASGAFEDTEVDFGDVKLRVKGRTLQY